MFFKKYFRLFFIALINFCILFAFISCGEHIHEFSKWKITTQPTCTVQGTKTRTCASCGFIEYSQIAPKGHTEVVDYAIKPTCTKKGKTAGSHCSSCNVIIKSQSEIPENNHSPVVDSAIAPTCTTEGRTEGTHCEICGVVITEQQIVEATGHDFDEGVIIKKATCVEDGTKKYTCLTPSCFYTCTDTYSLTKISATELYNMAVKYVGEIITYDKSGSEYALGTGFVISSDGKIVTNYHVIEGAYSASITINGKTYKIKSVLAYDANIDLAVLKIEASNLSFANICKQNVNVGSVVYAIGSSRGMTNTYSQGIVTYANREVDGVSHVQHDASITHGNSGGPLINEYGEVIGINTWGITDSQNLNFAVFTKELDNLVYGTPMTLAKFYEANFNAYETLLNWVLENYNNTGNSWIEYRYQESGERYSIYSLTYFYDTDTLSLTYYYVFNNGDARFVSIELSKDSTSYRYYARYTDGDYSYKKNETQGYIYPSSFTRYTSIVYYSSEGNYWTLSSLLETYQEGIVYSLDWFEKFLNVFGFRFTLSDFGFNSFS